MATALSGGHGEPIGALKEGLWVNDREDVEAHRRLLVRPVLNPAFEVSGGEVAKVNVGKGSESGEMWAYNGSVTAMPNEIKMLKYNLVIVEVPRRGGWIPGAQIVCVLSQGVLGAFHGHHGLQEPSPAARPIPPLVCPHLAKNKQCYSAPSGVKVMQHNIHCLDSHI